MGVIEHGEGRESDDFQGGPKEEEPGAILFLRCLPYEGDVGSPKGLSSLP